MRGPPMAKSETKRGGNLSPYGARTDVNKNFFRFTNLFVRIFSQFGVGRRGNGG